MSLVNKKVKIKIDEYNFVELSPVFIEFLNISPRRKIYWIGLVYFAGGSNLDFS